MCAREAFSSLADVPFIILCRWIGDTACCCGRGEVRVPAIIARCRKCMWGPPNIICACAVPKMTGKTGPAKPDQPDCHALGYSKERSRPVGCLTKSRAVNLERRYLEWYVPVVQTTKICHERCSELVRARGSRWDRGGVSMFWSIVGYCLRNGYRLCICVSLHSSILIYNCVYYLPRAAWTITFLPLHRWSNGTSPNARLPNLLRSQSLPCAAILYKKWRNWRQRLPSSSSLLHGMSPWILQQVPPKLG